MSGAWGKQSDGGKLGKEFLLGWILKAVFFLTLFVANVSAEQWYFVQVLTLWSIVAFFHCRPREVVLP